MESYLGVFHTTSDQALSYYVRIPGNIVDIRKTIMLPSCFWGHKNDPRRAEKLRGPIGGWNETKGNSYLKT
jgi:hypothetical protein